MGTRSNSATAKASGTANGTPSTVSAANVARPATMEIRMFPDHVRADFLDYHVGDPAEPGHGEPAGTLTQDVIIGVAAGAGFCAAAARLVKAWSGHHIRR
jgi:hypothetical protein